MSNNNSFHPSQRQLRSKLQCSEESVSRQLVEVERTRGQVISINNALALSEKSEFSLVKKTIQKHLLYKNTSEEMIIKKRKITIM